jgi:hypothetical protein
MAGESVPHPGQLFSDWLEGLSLHLQQHVADLQIGD